MRLPSDLIDDVFRWVDEQIARGAFNNRFTSHDAHKNHELLSYAKLAEYAVAEWCKLPRDAVQREEFEPAYDIAIGEKLIEVRSCEMYKRCLCWPATKVDKFVERHFTHLLLVKFEKPDLFLLRGWVTKDRFRRERIIATEDSEPPLDPGTRYMEEKNLDPMDTLFDDWPDPFTEFDLQPPKPNVGTSAQVPTSPKPPQDNPPLKEPGSKHFLHYCHCGEWGSFGFGVSLRHGKLGTWYCAAHRPTGKL